MERDDEVKGSGNSYDFGARMYDSRLGRWLSIDRQHSKYPWCSPYVFVANKPIVFVDPNGEEIIITGPQSKKIEKKLNKMAKNSEAFAALLEFFGGDIDLKINYTAESGATEKVDPNTGKTVHGITKGSFNRVDNMLYLNVEGLSSETITEEIFHVYQSFYYDNGTFENYINQLEEYNDFVESVGKDVKFEDYSPEQKDKSATMSTSLYYQKKAMLASTGLMNNIVFIETEARLFKVFVLMQLKDNSYKEAINDSGGEELQKEIVKLIKEKSDNENKILNINDFKNAQDLFYKWAKKNNIKSYTSGKSSKSAAKASNSLTSPGPASFIPERIDF